MSENYQQIGVKCPVCASERLIQLPHNLFEQKKFGNIKIQVPEQLVCEHPFILFLDNKGNVRGYERIDVLFDFKKVEKDLKEQKSREFSLRDILMQLGDFVLYHLLHGYVFNYSTYLLSQEIDVEFIGAIEKLFAKISPLKIGNTSTITPIEFRTYDNVKLKDKDALILSPEGYVVQCPWTSNIEFERQLVKQALDIIDIDSQNIVIEK